MKSLEKNWDLFEELKEVLGADYLLNELTLALNCDELNDNLEFIARVNDLNFEE
jgi:hypothetical protein